jgi:hypothetical protein
VLEELAKELVVEWIAAQRPVTSRPRSTSPWQPPCLTLCPLTCCDSFSRRELAARSAPCPDDMILDAISAKLVAHGHDLTGYCAVCGRGFAISMGVRIAERVRNSRVIGMRAIRCPRCVVLAEHRVTGPSRSA